jgi:hypothetical protein
MDLRRQKYLIVDPILSQEPEIGRWLWALQDTRQRTMSVLERLTPAVIDWAQITEYAAGTAPHDTEELYDLVYAAIARTRRSRHRLWACIHGSKLPWKRSVVEH